MKLYSRKIDGILLLNKPTGISSNSILQKVKRLFFAKKAGHAGSLDPIATGMLPICFGQATKFLKYLLNSDKRYLVTMRLGEKTDTYDSEGKIIKIRKVKIDKYKLDQTLNYFLHQTTQVPPMFSALKYKGLPLYQYARKGIVIPRKVRPIKIYSLKLLDWDFFNIKLDIHCSKGTYIRSIVDEFGERIGCGAHVVQLHRLNISNYSTNQMITLQYLKNIRKSFLKESKIVKKLDSLLLPIDSGILNFPKIYLSIYDIKKMFLGKSINIKEKLEIGLVRLIEKKSNVFFGIGEYKKSGKLIPSRLISKLN